MKTYDETKKEVTMWMNIIKIIAVFILLVFAGPTHKWALNTLGGIPCILSATYMILPRKWLKAYIIRVAMEDE